MITIRALDDGDALQVLDINAAATPAVAALDPAELARLMHLSDRHLAATRDADLLGYALVFRDNAAYDGEEFETLRTRLDPMPFLYIDQVAIRRELRGAGIGRRLYEALARAGVDAGIECLCCEVNVHPPNPESAAFHSRLGFGSLGRLRTGDGREVDLLAKRLDTAS